MAYARWRCPPSSRCRRPHRGRRAPTPARAAPSWTGSRPTCQGSRWRWIGWTPARTGRARSPARRSRTRSWPPTPSPAGCPGRRLRPVGSDRSSVVSGRRGAAVAAAAVAGSAAAVALRDPLRRARLARTARMWRLSARRGADWTAHRVRRAGASDERKAELDTRFVIRSAEDAARELGQMKGAMMKIGQLLGFILEGLPEDAQRALATLQADAPPMAPGLAASVVRRELGRGARAPLPPLDGGAGRGGQRRPGPPRGAARRPVRGGQGAVPRRRHGHPGRPRQRRGAVRPVLRVRPEGPRRPRARRRAPRADGRRARLPDRGRAPVRVRPQLPRPPVHHRAGRGRRAVDAAGAHDRVGGRGGVGRLPGHRGPRPTPTRRGGALPLRPGVDPPAGRLQRRPPPRQLPLPRRTAASPSSTSAWSSAGRPASGSACRPAWTPSSPTTPTASWRPWRR